MTERKPRKNSRGSPGSDSFNSLGAPGRRRKKSQSPSVADTAPVPAIPSSSVVAQNPFADQMPNQQIGGSYFGPGPQMHNRMPGPLPPPSGPPNSGKIYPPSASMVFNPSNPNAPPIYPCGICHKEVHDNDQAILCESGCNFWFHRSCTGLTEPAFHMLTQEVYAEWVCDNCLTTKNIPLVKMKS